LLVLLLVRMTHPLSAACHDVSSFVRWTTLCVYVVCALWLRNNKLKSVTHAVITMLYFSLNRCHGSSNWLILGKQHGKNDCMYMYACRPILLCVIIHFLTHTGSCGDHISNNYVSVSVGTAHIKMVSCSRVTTKIRLVHFFPQSQHGIAS